MSLIKDERSILKAVLGLLLVVFLSFLASKNPMDDSESTALSSVFSAASVEKTEITPDIQGSSTSSPPTPIKQINSGTDMLSLSAGEQFSLRTEFNDELNTVVLEVFHVTEDVKFTQLQSRGSDGSV